MKVLTYSHDSCGLGHLRRTFVISQSIARAFPSSSVLSIIGSTMAHQYFEEGDLNHDYIKLPCIQKTGAEQYLPRHLSIAQGELVELRKSLLGQTLAAFRPDIVIVDKNPTGLEDELREALERFRVSHPSSRIVLGLRDVLDHPEATGDDWSDPERVAWIDRIYDDIWIWGEPDIYDSVSDYKFAPELRAKTSYLGYLPPAAQVADLEALRRKVGASSPEDRLLLVATGGGGDAFPVLSRVVEGLSRDRDPHIKVRVIAGPLLAEDKYRKVIDMMDPEDEGMTITRFEKGFEDWIRASDAVISMGGYNTMRELTAIGRPALILPRTWPRREQSLRAEIFAARGWCEVAEEPSDQVRLVAEFAARLARGELVAPASTLQCRGLASMLETIGHMLPDDDEDPSALPDRRPSVGAAR